MGRFDATLARNWVRLYTGTLDHLSRYACEGFYDGDRLGAIPGKPVPVVLIIPAMSDVNGALPHPGVAVLQAVLRHEGIGCEVINYNLPINHPRDPTQHLIRALRAWGTRILGVSTYSQAIRQTLESLQQVKAAIPELTIILGGPHPTEAYLSLLGVGFVNYVCRGEAEESFPRLVRLLLNGARPAPGEIPGVYRYDRERGEIDGRAAPFVDLAALDAAQLLRYQFTREELRHQRRYRGCHGSAGAEYWPIALVRGCPYDCTYCAAYQMSGKRLRYRDVTAVVDDMSYYRRQYGRRHFSFIDDAFTQRYEYVVDLCREILNRKLDVCWTTDNGIRSETLGGGRQLAGALEQRALTDVDELLTLMIRAGWRGTAIGIESGSIRVRRELVRKGGANLSNDEILDNLLNLKRIAAREGVYFYVNGFMMAGFPDLPLPNGTVIPGETEAEREMTRAFALTLRDRGAVDMVSLNMLIPLPGTDMWDALAIDQKLTVLLGAFPGDHPLAGEVERIRADVLGRYATKNTRYAEEAEAYFWRQVYALPDEAQIRVMQAYDAFNIDASQDIRLVRPPPEVLARYREEVVDAFYGSGGMKRRMLRHVVHRSGGVMDVASYVTLLSRKYDPATKARGTRLNQREPDGLSSRPR